MRMVKLATIGTGIHATNALYPSLNCLEDLVQRVAVCDLDADLAKRVAGRYGFSHYYADYKKMLSKEKIDGVMVAINAKAHPQVIIDCLKEGVNVFVEKPAAVTVNRAKEVLEVSRRTGKIVMVDHQKRHSTAYKKAAEIVKREEFGEIVMIESKMHSFPYETIFNCLMEWHIHSIDIMRAFGGEIKIVKAMQNQISDNRTAIAILLKFENGVVGTLNWGTEAGPGVYCERLEIIGDKRKGVIIDNARRLTYYQENTGEIWEADWRPMRMNQSQVIDGYVGAIRHFTDCIQKQQQPSPNIYDEVKALEAIYEIAGQLNIVPRWTPVKSVR
jgi:predicted dehydrogenase